MKKILLILFLVIILLGIVAAWTLLGSGTGFSEKSRIVYIYSDSTSKESVLKTIRENKIVKNKPAFTFLADKMKYWSSVKPGRYEIRKGTNLLNIVKMLRNGSQAPVNFTITKIRTIEDFSRLVDRKFEIDSTDMMTFFTNKDTLEKFGLTRETVISMILPDTYTYFWNASPSRIFSKFHDASKEFWTDERKEKATRLGLTPAQAYTLASIIEEETNAAADKPKMASVYLNRLGFRMPLGADPTVKFALKNFGLKRILKEHTKVESPYNTYRVQGLPPGPICTPSRETIESVLTSPKTDYLYFVANSDFSGTHLFTTNHDDHMKLAREFHQAMNRQDSIRKARQATQQ